MFVPSIATEREETETERTNTTDYHSEKKNDEERLEHLKLVASASRERLDLGLRIESETN